MSEYGENGPVFVRRGSDLQGHSIPYFIERSGDEIDLGRFCRGMLQQWKAMTTIVCIGIALSIALALYWPKIYLVESTLYAPSFRELGDLKNQDIIDVTPQDALQGVVDWILMPDVIRDVLESSAWWEKVSEGNNVSSVSMAKDIRENLELSRVKHDYYELGKDEKTPFREVKIALPSRYPQETVTFLKTLITTAHKSALARVTGEIQSTKQNRIESIQKQLKYLAEAAKQSREAKIIRLRAENNEAIAKLQQQIDLKVRKAKQDRENRIIRLSEALRTAEALNIKEPVTWDDLRPLRKSTQINNELGSRDSTEPLYFRGTRLLDAELDRLNNRENDKPYVNGLTELEYQLNQIRNDPSIAALESRTDDVIYVEEFDGLQRQLTSLLRQPNHFENAQMAVIGQPPSASNSPRRSPWLILLLGLFVSGFIALLVGFVLAAIRNSPGASPDPG